MALAAVTSVPITVAFRDQIRELTGQWLVADTPGQFAVMILVLAVATARASSLVITLVTKRENRTDDNNVNQGENNTRRVV